MRIAQELHDVVAHNVSLIVVQAQALGATVGDERVREATDGIADLGRQAMTEMHRTLKLLRARGDDAAARAPQPGLGELPDLLERRAQRGLGVQPRGRGRAAPAARQSVDLSAYRIVQEALTNVVKHAGRARARRSPLGYRARRARAHDRRRRRAAAPPAAAPAATGWSGCASAPRCSAAR